ncbi:MAG: Gfo/Idh/MocA family oxidoreductase [Alistipes sp.]|jgi:predicted dehydrogenase|nr:Gfo/Idh/MocA family oxidoreductase [Alistipes sp.]
MKKQTNTRGAMPRRDFLKLSAIGAAAAIGAPAMLASCGDGGSSKLVPLKKPGEYYIPELPDKAPDGRPLKAGLIGCGGRGTGAAVNFLNSANGVEIVALGDVFADRLNNTRNKLTTEHGQTITDEMCFIGFDSYQKVIDAGVDVVLLCTPPAFRPQHFKYAVDKGVHSFLEKPVAVDSEGYRSVVASARVAASKNLSVITGTQRHHQRSYLASYQKIMEGAIGEIRGGNVYWNQSQLWHRPKQEEWTDMEWMIRDWVNWTWLCGDEIVEQHVHNIDVFTWFSGLKPVSAIGVGSRQRRITGDGYDNFSIDFEFENGIHLHSMCRQIDGTPMKVTEIIQGTKGVWYSDDGHNQYITDLAGKEIWRYDPATAQAAFTQNDPYTLEHVNLVASIRAGVPVNQAEETAISSLAGIMGRDAAYTGALVTWDEESAKTHGIVPVDPKLENMDMTKFAVPVPGTGK